jgi:ABC-type amino acid transport system permease subunit
VARIVGGPAGARRTFGLGFAAPFLNVTGQLALIAIGLAIFVGMPVAVGRIARSGWAALFSSAAFVPLAWLATGYGIYLARETGWPGLRQLGESTDSPGVNGIWLILIAALLFWFLAAFLLGLVSA